MPRNFRVNEFLKYSFSDWEWNYIKTEINLKDQHSNWLSLKLLMFSNKLKFRNGADFREAGMPWVVFLPIMLAQSSFISPPLILLLMTLWVARHFSLSLVLWHRLSCNSLSLGIYLLRSRSVFIHHETEPDPVCLKKINEASTSGPRPGKYLLLSLD